jgi:DNA invertase Pin-like site-specific DNA recombinase
LHIFARPRKTSESASMPREARSRVAAARQAEIVRWFVEHESGGDNSRPELDRAVRHARRVQAIVCVAKLDRLARDAQFLMRLYDGNVPIIFGDLPEIDGSAASRVMVQMLAAFAEFERRRGGERMRDWWRQRKAQQLPAGCPRNMSQEGRLKGAATAAVNRTARAIDEMTDIAEIAAEKVKEGWSHRRIAAYLNAEGYPTRHGKDWHAVQVSRVLKRVKAT